MYDPTKAVDTDPTKSPEEMTGSYHNNTARPTVSRDTDGTKILDTSGAVDEREDERAKDADVVSTGQNKTTRLPHPPVPTTPLQVKPLHMKGQYAKRVDDVSDHPFRSFTQGGL